MNFALFQEGVGIELPEGRDVAFKLLEGQRDLAEDFKGVHEALQAFARVISSIQNGGDVDQDFRCLRLLIEAIFMASFHAEECLLVINDWFVMHFMLLQQVC